MYIHVHVHVHTKVLENSGKTTCVHPNKYSAHTVYVLHLTLKLEASFVHAYYTMYMYMYQGKI